MSTLLLNVTFSQLTPQQAILQMQRGINIGNTLDAHPNETSWGNPTIQKYYFDDYANAGFTCVRIPITWMDHVSKNSPYTINPKWLARVDTVVTWGLNKGLYIVINAHHELGLKATDTMKDLVAKADTLAKFDSIWSQVSRHFKDKSNHLLFEILNEPNPMTQASVDSLNKRVLAIIRKTNPTRIVLYSGNSFSNSDQLVGARIPDTNDKYLIGYYHSYDPWNFGGLGIGTYGSSSDISTTAAKFIQVSNWSVKNNIPVTLDECGAMKLCDYNSRMIYYATLVEQSLKYKFAFNVWDDNGDWQTYIRSSRKWNDLKDVIIHTYKESPTQLNAIVKDTSVTLSWLNRTTLNDSIYLDRRTANTTFAQIAKLSPSTSQFQDSALSQHTIYYYRLRTNLLDSIDLYSYPISASIVGIRKPYLGSAASIPGTIQAENFDIGGEGQTYHYNTTSNKGGAYRLSEGVDIEARPDSGYQIGYAADGEWTQYSIHVDIKGLYDIGTYTASVNGGGKYNFIVGNTSTSSVTVPKTGDSTTLAVSSVLRVSLDTGNQILTFKILAGTKNPFTIDRFVFIQDTSKSAINNVIINSNITIFPNPVKERATIVYSNKNEGSVNISIYNVSGQKIKSLVSSSQVAGDYTTTWNLTDNNGLQVSNGIYICRITQAGNVSTSKIIVLK